MTLKHSPDATEQKLYGAMISASYS